MPPPPPAPPGATTPGGAPPKPPGRRGLKRLRLVLVAVLALVVAWAVYLVAVPVSAWGDIARVDDTPKGERPAQQPGTLFLLVGSDSREGLSAAERKKLHTGDAEGQRTDTIMLLYVPPGGEPALISLPRDSYVPIPGNGSNKINAAYSFGGAPLLERTVEQATGLRIDGYVEIGFGGFVSVIDAVDGVDMCVKRSVKDKKSKLNVKKGCQTFDGQTALAYVRMRYHDPLGDLGRVQRQRQMVGAVVHKTASPATVLNPVRYWKVAHAGADSVTLGTDTSAAEMSSFVRGMRAVSGTGGLTLTVPISDPNYQTSAGSSVLWDAKKSKAMFAAIARGDTSGLAKYAK